MVPVLISLALLDLLAMFLRYPLLKDVTTTPENPPRFRIEPPGDVDYPEQHAELQQCPYPDLVPGSLPDSVSAPFRLGSRSRPDDAR